MSKSHTLVGVDKRGPNQGGNSMRRSKCTSFTLIELLVVIAIIAILAAILFPVFAKAREAAYKSQNVSNVKQMGTSLQIYMADNDDVTPLTQPVNHRTNRSHGMVGWGQGAVANPSAGQWANENGWFTQLLPYTKNRDIMTNQNPAHEFPVWTAPAGHPAVGFRANLTMNGYLQSISSSQITSPSVVPVFWQGLGIVNYTQGAYVIAPILLPRDASAYPISFTAPLYKFTRSGATCTLGWMGNWGQWHRSYFVHGKGFVASRMDGSARFYNSAIGPKENSPFTTLTSAAGRWPGTLEGSAEVGESANYFGNLDPTDGPGGCTYMYFFSPFREQ